MLKQILLTAGFASAFFIATKAPAQCACATAGDWYSYTAPSSLGPGCGYAGSPACMGGYGAGAGYGYGPGYGAGAGYGYAGAAGYGPGYGPGYAAGLGPAAGYGPAVMVGPGNAAGQGYTTGPVVTQGPVTSTGPGPGGPSQVGPGQTYVDAPSTTTTGQVVEGTVSGPVFGYDAVEGPTTSTSAGTVTYGPAAGVSYGPGYTAPAMPVYSSGYGTMGYGATMGYGYGGGYSTGYGYGGTSYGSTTAASSSWAVSAGALYIDRLDSAHYTYSFDTANEQNQYLDQRDTDFGIAPGFEVRLTQLDPCGQSGVELVYWQLFPGDQSSTLLGSSLPGNLNAILNYDQLNYNGNTADTYTDNAWAHRLRREMSVHNVEANHIAVIQDGSAGGINIGFLSGVRMFRLREFSQFASDPNDAAFTGEVDELYYNINATNTLLGCQLGTYVSAPVTCRFSVIAGAKAGAFANIAEAQNRIFGAAGTATINNGPFNGRTWRVNSNNVDLAMLAELQLGAAYQVTCNWRLSADYRMVGISGLALPHNQIYHDLRGINDVALLDTSGTAIFHGGFVGLDRCF